MDFEKKISSRFEFLYDDHKGQEHLERFNNLLKKYGYDLNGSPENRKTWDQKDAILITYGDVIENKEKNGQGSIPILEKFVDEHLSEELTTIHILPFFPSSSDGGFSVIDYKSVRNDLGDWSDIKRLSEKYKVMADLVINHTSRFSNWFENYEQGESPGKDYFIEVEAGINLSEVTRPRSSPLLTAVNTKDGLKHVWTTFSDDQVDLDFSNPDVLFEFLDIFLFYLSKGIKVIRLDAIAYLWKKIGTTSIHLEQTHQVVKLFRDIADAIDPEVTLITETNVPFRENVSYFGKGDEAHMIYQFSLPPLLLHAILTENAQYLSEWASELPEPPGKCTYFNFTASHDGIGVRPLEGLVPEEEFDYLIKSTKERGGFVSFKQNNNGTQSPYELNITYFDAFAERGKPVTEKQIKRYMCSQVIMLSLKGVPGIYFHNFTATRNNLNVVLKTGEKRAISRARWQYDELMQCIEQPDHCTHVVLYEYKELLTKRKQHPAFDPEGPQEIIDIWNNVFALIRTAPDGDERILALSNVTGENVELSTEGLEKIPSSRNGNGFEDLLSGKQMLQNGTLELEPFQSVWLKLV